MTAVPDEETLCSLRNSVEALLRQAQAALTFSKDPGDIKRACDALSEILRTWHVLDNHVSSSVRGLLQLVRQNCGHPNASRGYNERDGSWMNPCPTCGASG